jgi:hypothetical protein
MFRPSTLEILTDERVRSLQAFSETAGPVLQSHIPTAEYIIDVLSDYPMAWSELDEHPSTKDLEMPTVARGGLDFIAACLCEDKRVANSWELFSEASYPGEFEKDLATYGLHGIHFRMNLKTQSDRITYTCMLAEAMYDRTSRANQVGTAPITALSVLRGRLASCIEWHVANGDSWKDGYPYLSVQELKMLCGPTDHPALPIEDKTAFRQILRKIIFKNEFAQAWEISSKVEAALLPLVYNYGYKLKARGLLGPEVMAKVLDRTESLLSFVPATREFLKALERQILINLFSAFPEDLEMLNAQPEELQGVMLNPVLIMDRHAKYFNKTLAGPLALFSHRHSAPTNFFGTQIVNFFKTTAYPLHLDIAVQGYLQGYQEIINLAENCPGRSMAVEQLLLGDEANFDPHIGLIRYLTEPEQLDSYSDEAVVKLIERFIIDDQLDFVRTGKGVSTEAPSVAPVLSQRPQLFEPMVKMLEEHGRLDSTLFEWCGYGVKELKALGKRAPNELKRDLLEDSLGF